jgi:hypothetical protein
VKSPIVEEAVAIKAVLSNITLTVFEEISVGAYN